jgi:hypothetical protein
VFRASWVLNPLWSPQWEGQTSDLGGIPRKGGGEMLIVSDEVGTDRPKQVTTAD